MTDVISQPSKPQNEPSESRETLVRSLDNLFEHYLCLLDHYQDLQKSLTKSLSTGFLSLTKANFTSPNHIRYGQDFYDNRMQASLQVYEGYSLNSLSDRHETDDLPRTIAMSKPYIITNAAVVAPTNDCSESNLPKPSEYEDLKEGIGCQDEVIPVPKTLPVHSNPINWFGILAPSDLRLAQAHFNAAVTPGIVELANTTLEMREAEVRIRELREDIRNSR